MEEVAVTGKDLVVLKQEFESIYNLAQDKKVQRIISDVSANRQSVADGEVALQDIIKRPGRSSLIIHTEEGKVKCFDFIFFHYTVGEGWDWGKC